ncbi:MAG TPA: alpha-amylase family glycosyl hydrolase [Candidatus Polarisedimenticolia bacterium]|nr:alpha-amylase family glycosyl hydrolase [Candidatus Polarisedimenticolia bacterium]
MITSTADLISRKTSRIRRHIFLTLTAAAVSTAFPLLAQNSGNSFWQRQSIYQIITDRFFDGDPSNNNADGNYDSAGRISVHGGDFKGIEEKLDYIKSLGATAIWISPVVLNQRGAFHGYAGIDFYKVDPHWGTMADLKHLVEAAHARGILVIDDIVVNHGGNLVDSADAGYPKFKSPPDGYHLRFRNPAKQYPAPFEIDAVNPSLTNLFHNSGSIQNYEDSTQVQLGELSSLDDFRTENPYVREQMKKIYEFWIQQAGFDGFRIDTVKHVETGFWQEWCPAIRAFAAERGKSNFFMFGEVLDSSDAKCGSYIGETGGGPFKLDSVLDYTLYFKIDSLFAGASAPTKLIADHYQAVAANYDPAAQNQLVTFLDNHDQPRFLSIKGATIDRLKTALVFLYTTRGVPCLYYGTEQAFNGARDPWDREDMFAGKFEWGPSRGDNFNMTHPLFEWVAQLNNLRRLYPALQTGAQSNLWSDANGPGLFAFTRRLGTQEVFVVFNTANANKTLPPCSVICAPGTKMQNVLDARESFAVSDGGRTPSLVLPGTSAEIFVEESQVRPLDPVVAEISPAHEANEIPPTAPIVIHFSKSMDAASVERAFSTIPAVKGAFSWNKTRDQMSFTPDSPGFPALSMITVHIGDAARDRVSGRNFYAAFESRYHCGISNLYTNK